MANYGPSDIPPNVPTDQGYFVNFPQKALPTESRHTAQLSRPDGTSIYLWVHEVEQNFEIGGNYAQSHRHRAWYPRNFVQPRLTVRGQFPNQALYGQFAEWVRTAQMQCQRARVPDKLQNTMHLTIHSGNVASTLSSVHKRYAHDGVSVRGHILKVERNTERWVNAPEFTFEFNIVSATHGVLTTGLEDPTYQLDKIAMAMQFPNEKRPLSWEKERGTTGTVSFVADPDILLLEQKDIRAKEAEAAAKKVEQEDAAFKGGGGQALIPGLGDVPVSGEGVGSVLQEARRIDAQNLPYAWGGGHAKLGVPSKSIRPGESQVGFDCSGYVSACLGAGGYIKAPMDSNALMGVGKAGRGTDFTVYANSEHTFIMFEQGDIKRADTSDYSQGGKPDGPHTRSQTRPTAGFTARHF